MAQPTEVGGNPVAEAEGLGGGIAGVVHQHHKSQVGPGGVSGEVGDDVPGRGHSWIYNILLKEQRVSKSEPESGAYIPLERRERSQGAAAEPSKRTGQ